MSREDELLGLKVPVRAYGNRASPKGLIREIFVYAEGAKGPCWHVFSTDSECANEFDAHPMLGSKVQGLIEQEQLVSLKPWLSRLKGIYAVYKVLPDGTTRGYIVWGGEYEPCPWWNKRAPTFEPMCMTPYFLGRPGNPTFKRPDAEKILEVVGQNRKQIIQRRPDPSTLDGFRGVAVFDLAALCQ